MLRFLVRLAVPMLGAVTAPVLQGCADRGVQVPDFVQEMVDADVPADGQVHEQARGSFRIDRTTAFCTFRPGYGLDTGLLYARLRQIGQNSVQEGVDRQHRANASPQCIPDRSVFVRAVATPDRERGPYKLVLAVWQGEAACVAAIERSDGRRPGARVIGGPLFDPFDRYYGPRLRRISIDGDMADLSRACLARFSGNH